VDVICPYRTFALVLPFATEPPGPIWRRDQDLLAQLEAIGRRRDYVESNAPALLGAEVARPANST